MNQNDVTFLVRVLKANRRGQLPVYPARGEGAAAWRLEQSGFIVGNPTVKRPTGYISTIMAEAWMEKCVDLLYDIRNTLSSSSDGHKTK